MLYRLASNGWNRWDVWTAPQPNLSEWELPLYISKILNESLDSHGDDIELKFHIQRPRKVKG